MILIKGWTVFSGRNNKVDYISQKKEFKKINLAAILYLLFLYIKHDYVETKELEK